MLISRNESMHFNLYELAWLTGMLIILNISPISLHVLTCPRWWTTDTSSGGRCLSLHSYKVTLVRLCERRINLLVIRFDSRVI